MSITFEKITSKTLSEAFSIVRLGFDLNREAQERLYQLIVASNDILDFYGYSISSNGAIVGVLFTPIQGQSSEGLGVSLVALYILPAYRGMITIRFMSYAIRHLKQKFSFINNYTARPEVVKILEGFGFKQMNTTTLRLKLSRFPVAGVCGLFSRFSANISIAQAYYEAQTISVRDYDLNVTNNLKVITIRLPDSEGYLHIYGYFSKRFRVAKCYTGIASNNEELLIANLAKVQYLLFRHCRAFFFYEANKSIVDTVCASNSHLTFKSNRVYLALGINIDYDYMPALGSEMPELNSIL